MKPKRILFLNTGGEWYGSDKILYLLLQFLRPHHECLAVLPFAERLDRKLADAGLPFVVQHFAVLRRKFCTPWGALYWCADFLISTVRLAWLVARYRPDIIYSNAISVLEGAILSRLFRCRHIWHMQDIFERPAPVSRLLRWCARRFADDLVCVSEAVARHMGPCAALKIVHNGIAPVVAKPNFDRKHPEGPFTVGVVGRFCSYKGQLDLLRALAYLRRERRVGDGLRALLIGGEFAQEDWWHRQARTFLAEHHLEQVVEIGDFTDAIAEVYSRLDLFVLPTIQPDPFPTVVLEAMSCGVPVVAYRSGGVEEALDHDPDCLVDLQDHEGLGRTIQRFMEDEPFRRAKAQAQYERYCQHFTLEKFEARFLGMLGLGPVS
jgi:glycosyltransferase involved in cell wall biosynthesis